MLPLLKEEQVKSEAGTVWDEDDFKNQVNTATHITKVPTTFDKEQLSLAGTLENAIASLTFDGNKSQPIEPASVDASTSSDAKIFSLTSENQNISLNTSSTYGWEFEDNLSTFEDPKSKEHNTRIQSSVVKLNDCSYDRTKVMDSPPIIPIEGSNDQISNDDDVMETINLSSNVKPDQRPITADRNTSFAASYRKKDFSYYKKLIKNALTSRKRLAKEYEHLPILHGDIGARLEPHSSSSSTRTPSSHENEWELL